MAACASPAKHTTFAAAFTKQILIVSGAAFVLLLPQFLPFEENLVALRTPKSAHGLETVWSAGWKQTRDVAMPQRKLTTLNVLATDKALAVGWAQPHFFPGVELLQGSALGSAGILLCSKVTHRSSRWHLGRRFGAR